MRRSDGEVVLFWPLVLHVITAGWTYNDGSSHKAIDLRCSPGTPVYAAESGKVVTVQKWDGKTKTGMQSYGNMVYIKHDAYKGKTLHTRYAHLNSMVVRVGQWVNEGDLIGYSGNTGNSFGPHLHFEVVYNGIRNNPLNWLDDDFSCASDIVAVHLGKYTSITRETKRMQVLTIGPVSAGDAMSIYALCKTLKITDAGLYKAKEV